MHINSKGRHSVRWPSKIVKDKLNKIILIQITCPPQPADSQYVRTEYHDNANYNDIRNNNNYKLLK